jgi:hypothetical protein
VKEKIFVGFFFFLFLLSVFSAWNPKTVKEIKENAEEHFQGKVVKIADFFEETPNQCFDEKIATVNVSRVFRTAHGLREGYNIDVRYPEEKRGAGTECKETKAVEPLALGDLVEVWANETIKGSGEFQSAGMGYTIKVLEKNEIVRGATMALIVGIVFIGIFALAIVGQKAKYWKKKARQ